MLAFTNPLAEPVPRRESPPTARLILWGLLFACLIPRALMAAHVEVICADGAFFVELAQQIDRDQPREAVGQYDANLFPLILIGLHNLGLSWEDGGAWWGVLCGSFAVWPLHGWMRRQFDDRIALISCLLYAAHPKLIEWSPEIVREPTFWLLLTSSLYFTHRALSELQYRWFFLGGLTTVLAIMTRFEGWFLLGAIAIWVVQRWKALTVARGHLLAGMACLAVCFPVCLEGLTQGYGYEHWPIGNSQRMRLVQEWFESWVAHKDLPAKSSSAQPETESPTTQHIGKSVGKRAAAPLASSEILSDAVPVSSWNLASFAFAPWTSSFAWMPAFLQEPGDAPLVAPPVSRPETLSSVTASPSEPQPDDLPPALVSTEADAVVLSDSPPNEIDVLSGERSAKKTAWVFAHTLERGFTPVFGILLAIGYLTYWRLQLRADLIPMFLWSQATLAGMWIHLWAAQESSSRYATSIVILATPFAALGIYNLVAVVQFITAKFKPRWRKRPAFLVATMILVITGVGWADALCSGYEGRAARVDLGTWIHERYGAGTVMLGSHRWSQSNHYALGMYYTLPAIDCTLDEIDSLITRLGPQLIVLSGTEMTPEQWNTVSDHCAALGFERLPDGELPQLCQHKIVVLQKRLAAPRMARGN